MDPSYIEELQQSILAVGLLQEPLGRELDDGLVQLAFGHTRLEAVRGLRDAGKWGPMLSVKLQRLSDEDMAYIALEENRRRKDLTPMEEIAAWAKVLQEIPGVTVQSLADRIGVARSTMSENLAILELPRSVLDLVDSGQMTIGAAQEFLVLRNQDHCHEDAIALVLQDLSGHSRYYDSKPPDYRIKTVRASIRGVATGNAAYGYDSGFQEASRSWRPLFEGGRHGRAISFDVEAFKDAYPNSVHLLPEGEVSGGAPWTCEARAWGSWSARASRDATKATAEGGEAKGSTSASKSNAEAEWWKAVKRDPVVREVVGSRLRTAKSPKDLTEEDKAALGTRVQRPRMNDVVGLPGEAQPEGFDVGTYRANRPPMFDFSECATCVVGASWRVAESWERDKPRLVCTNKKAWLDKRSAGMQAWVEWKDRQVEIDEAHDREAISRLMMAQIGQEDARGLVGSMWPFLRDPKRMEPLSIYSGIDWNERARYHYWPVGAVRFAEIAGLELPVVDANYRHQDKWEKAAGEWWQAAPEGTDWVNVLATLLVWQARLAWGVGKDIWGTVGIPTVVHASPREEKEVANVGTD